MSRGRLFITLCAVLLGAVSLASGAQRAPAATERTCSAGYVHANLSWGEKCLRAGELCKVANPEYHAYGFDCPASGRLVAYSGGSTSTTAKTAVEVGRTVLLKPRTRASACARGSLPDGRCSPGAYYAKLTRNVICASSFRTASVRNVPQSEKYAVEREYGMVARRYGRAIEIDHIVSLELGGSNDIANLFPEPGSGHANYHLKDQLENRVRTMVCAGRITLRRAQSEIAGNWEQLYRRVVGRSP